MSEVLEFQGLKVAKADFSAKPGAALRQPIIVSLLCGVSTVNDDVLACGERRTGRTEPEHGAGNLLPECRRNRFLHLGLALGSTTF